MISVYEDKNLDQTGLPIRGRVRLESGTSWIAERILWRQHDYETNCGDLLRGIRKLIDMHNRLASECETRYGGGPDSLVVTTSE
jgi:hypothetical protein